MQYYIQSRFYWVRTVIIYCLLTCIIFIMELIGVVKPLQQLYGLVTQPLAIISSGLTYKLNTGILRTRELWNATNELALTKKENAILMAEVSQLELVRKENQALKLLIGADSQVGSSSTKKRFATIIGYASPTITFENATLVPGSLVLSQGTLLGFVDEVVNNQASVVLLSSRQTKPLLVRSESGVEGIITGNNRSIIITDIPKDVQPKSGERLVTAGQEGVPASIFVGTISEVVESPTSPVLSFVVNQTVSFFNSTLVEIL